jgi:hypothetical protein
VDLLSGGGGVNWTDYRCFLIFFRFFPSLKLTEANCKFPLEPPTLVHHSTTYSTYNLPLLNQSQWQRERTMIEKPTQVSGKPMGKQMPVLLVENSP